MTYLFPKDWRTVPLGLSLLMGTFFSFDAMWFSECTLTDATAPWGGHACFPQIYRDMRHPHKYTRGVNYTYVFVVS